MIAEVRRLQLPVKTGKWPNAAATLQRLLKSGGRLVKHGLCFRLMLADGRGRFMMECEAAASVERTRNHMRKSNPGMREACTE